MYGYIISPHTPSCGRLWQTRAAASANPRHAGHMDAFSPQSFADALERVVAATPVQIASCSSACCMNVVWEWKQHTIPGRLTLKPCLIWAIYGFLLLNDINRKSLWSQRVCGVHVGFFSSVCLRLKTSLTLLIRAVLVQSSIWAVGRIPLLTLQCWCAQPEICPHLHIHNAEK